MFHQPLLCRASVCLLYSCVGIRKRLAAIRTTALSRRIQTLNSQGPPSLLVAKEKSQIRIVELLRNHGVKD
jgi:hypothetical protein